MTSLSAKCAAALAQDPSSPVIEYDGRWHNWGDLKQVADQLHSLLEMAGVDPSAPVIFIPRNHPASVAALFALLAQQRTIRMIYAFQSPAGIARDIQRLQAPVVVGSAQEFSDEVLATLQSLGAAGIALDGMAARAVTGAKQAREGFAALPPAEPQIEILTSGTTGPPKQFPISYAMISQLLSHSSAMPGYGKTAAPDVPFLLYFPLGNISGIYTAVPSLLMGQRAVLMDRFNLAQWHDYVLRYRPMAGGLPPAAVRMVLDADIPVEDLSSMKTMGTGAEPLDPNVQKAFEERYGIPILLSYGATEFAGPVTAMTAELHAEWGQKKFGTVGRPIGGAKLRVIHPETGALLPPGEEGILEVVSPRIGQDWIRTSDLAVVDEDGFLFHRGRADGAIMRGGFKILPETIERALALHPAIAAVSAVGVPDQRLGEVPAVALQVAAGHVRPGTEELEQHLRQHVLSTHIPVHWAYVDTLPKTLSFKIDRQAVKNLFA